MAHGTARRVPAASALQQTRPVAWQRCGELVQAERDRLWACGAASGMGEMKQARRREACRRPGAAANAALPHPPGIGYLPKPVRRRSPSFCTLEEEGGSVVVSPPTGDVTASLTASARVFM